jgi:hypothetical protein
MSIVVLKNKITRQDFIRSSLDHKNYIKITADLSQDIVAIGGEYHADSEKLLIENYNSVQKYIWGGGYNISTKQFETIAIINIRQNSENQSMEIINPKIRKKFLDVVKKKLGNIESLI